MHQTCGTSLVHSPDLSYGLIFRGAFHWGFAVCEMLLLRSYTCERGPYTGFSTGRGILEKGIKSWLWKISELRKFWVGFSQNDGWLILSENISSKSYERWPLNNHLVDKLLWGCESGPRILKKVILEFWTPLSWEACNTVCTLLLVFSKFLGLFLLIGSS